MSDSLHSIVTRLRKCEDERRTATPTTAGANDAGADAITCIAADLVGGARGDVDAVSTGAPTEAKTNRAVHKWQPASEELFYEGVKLHGKNYQLIERYMSSKTRDRAFAKNYEQIRHHYYNQVKLLTQLVPLNDVEFGTDVRLSRDVRELFLLVNNAVWSRATKSMRATKNAAKLRELILTGSTTLKVTGKPARTLRTPQCPALRKFFEEDSTTQFTRLLSDEIIVELVPATQIDAEHVSRSLHNPFVRLKMNASDSLRPLFTTLQRRWSDKQRLADETRQPDKHDTATLTILASGSQSLTDVRIREANATSTSTVVCLNEYVKRHIPKLTATTVSSPAKATTFGHDLSVKPVAPRSSTSSESSFSAAHLRAGITESTCGCMTAGHLALMYSRLLRTWFQCNGASVVRLQYTIQPPAASVERVISDRTWRCLVTLLRRGFAQDLHKNAVPTAHTPHTSATSKIVMAAPTIQTQRANANVLTAVTEEYDHPAIRMPTVLNTNEKTLVAVNRYAGVPDREDTDYTAFEQQMMNLRAQSRQRKRKRAARDAFITRPMQINQNDVRARKLPPPIITSEPMAVDTVAPVGDTVAPARDTVASSMDTASASSTPASSTTVEPFAHWKTPPKRQPVVTMSSGLTRFAGNLSVDGWSRSESGTFPDECPRTSATKLPTDFGDQGDTLNTPPKKR